MSAAPCLNGWSRRLALGLWIAGLPFVPANLIVILLTCVYGRGLLGRKLIVFGFGRRSKFGKSARALLPPPRPIAKRVDGGVAERPKALGC